jgi:acetyl-CoA carboxylase biotin carboxyl carrier protein
VQAILKLLDDSPYNELNLETDSFTLYLKRSSDGSTDSKRGWTQSTHTHGIGQTSPLASDKTEAPVADEPVPSEAGLLDLRSPMVGTFYATPKPGADPFINVGDAVSNNSIICIIEVMKLMSSVPAGVSGTVREILVSDAQFVEKGQLLMRVKPAP